MLDPMMLWVKRKGMGFHFRPLPYHQGDHATCLCNRFAYVGSGRTTGVLISGRLAKVDSPLTDAQRSVGLADGAV